MTIVWLNLHGVGVQDALQTHTAKPLTAVHLYSQTLR
jgi:hypothetical protein